MFPSKMLYLSHSFLLSSSPHPNPGKPFLKMCHLPSRRRTYKTSATRSTTSRQNNCFSVNHLFLDSEPQLVRSKDFNNKGLKYRSIELLKGTHFCHQKKIEKADKLCMKFSSNSNTRLQRSLNPLFQNRHSLFLLPPLFKEYLSLSSGSAKLKKVSITLFPQNQPHKD